MTSSDSPVPGPRPNNDAETEMAGYLARIATGPRLSKDLSREQAARAMTAILAGDVDRAQAAVFLIALRMKRETHDELCGVLDALRAAAVSAVAEVDNLVHMAEPYNGYVRHLPAAPFVPALLAACGVPCVIHGCREVAPKFGVTAHRILEAAGVPVQHSPAHVARAVEQAGWGYVDVRAYCPPLADLARLRTLIVKRSCLSLLEKLLRPISARSRQHLWIGYTHREYPEILHGLARVANYDTMLAVRGVEGGVLTSLAGAADAVSYQSDRRDALVRSTIAASEVQARTDRRAPALPDATGTSEAAAHSPRGHRVGAVLPAPDTLTEWAKLAAQAGLRALAGEPGLTSDLLVLGASAVLRHLGLVASLAEGAQRARRALNSGEAARHFASFTSS